MDERGKGGIERERLRGRGRNGERGSTGVGTLEKEVEDYGRVRG